MASASPVQSTVTAHRVGRLCVLALRDTTELLETPQKWDVPVSLVLVFACLQLAMISSNCHYLNLKLKRSIVSYLVYSVSYLVCILKATRTNQIRDYNIMW